MLGNIFSHRDEVKRRRKHVAERRRRPSVRREQEPFGARICCPGDGQRERQVRVDGEGGGRGGERILGAPPGAAQVLEEAE